MLQIPRIRPRQNHNQKQRPQIPQQEQSHTNIVQAQSSSSFSPPKTGDVSKIRSKSPSLIHEKMAIILRPSFIRKAQPLPGCAHSFVLWHICCHIPTRNVTKVNLRKTHPRSRHSPCFHISPSSRLTCRLHRAAWRAAPPSSRPLAPDQGSETPSRAAS